MKVLELPERPTLIITLRRLGDVLLVTSLPPAGHSPIARQAHLAV
jgi:hypothetical protein